MVNIFDSIKWDIARTGKEIQGGKRWFEYKLPRQCGASTFMASFANERAEAGENVLYLEQRSHLMNGYGISEKVKVLPCSGGYQYWLHIVVHAKEPFDWIICDCVGPLQMPQWFRPAIRFGAKKGILWIDNVEGEYVYPSNDD